MAYYGDGWVESYTGKGKATQQDFERMALMFGRLEKKLNEKAKKMVLPNVRKVMEEYQIGMIQTEGLVDTGQLRDSVRGIEYEDRVNVAPMGKRAERRSNALVAAMLDLGEKATSERKGRGKGKGWLTRANEAAAEEVFRIASDALGELIDETFDS